MAGMLGKAVREWASERLAVGYNDLLDQAYDQADVKVAERIQRVRHGRLR